MYTAKYTIYGLNDKGFGRNLTDGLFAICQLINGSCV